MKTGTQPEDPPTDQPTNTPAASQVPEAKPILDSEGLDKAYQQGDIYGNKNIAYVAGSHTARDWLADVTKNSTMAVCSRGAQPNRKYNELGVGSSGVWSGRLAKIRTLSKSIRIP